MKTNKNILRLLLIALVIIWGLIVYQIISAVYFSGDDEVGNTNSFIMNKDKNTGRFVYNDSIRDPFQFRSMKINTTKRVKLEPATPVWNPPPFQLKGIIDARSGKMAILEDQSGETFFLQRGDTLQGMRILAIGPNRVQYQFNKKKSDWRLEEN